MDVMLKEVGPVNLSKVPAGGISFSCLKVLKMQGPSTFFYFICMTLEIRWGTSTHSSKRLSTAQQDITGIWPLVVSLLPFYRFAVMFVVASAADFKISDGISSSFAFSQGTCQLRMNLRGFPGARARLVFLSKKEV